MPVYSRQVLSGSSNGLPIQITATSSPGDTIHTVGPTATGDKDIIYLYFYNGATVDREVTVEFGGTATAQHLTQSIQFQEGPNLIIPGYPLTATTSIVRAFNATATAGIYVLGKVNRATG